MVNRLIGKKVIGIKQVIKAIKTTKVKAVYVSKDSDDKLVEPIRVLAKENSIEIFDVATMKELGKLCGIDVGAATAAIIDD